LAIKHGRVSFLFCMLASADPLPPSATYRNLPTLPFDTVKANDEAAKPKVMQRQRDLLNQRYDLADRPQPGVVMSGGRKPVQGGVRVKLPAGVTWESLATVSTEEIRPKLCRRSSLDRCPEGSSHIPESEEAALPVRLQ
jgi:hypothetical protein